MLILYPQSQHSVALLAATPLQQHVELTEAIEVSRQGHALDELGQSTADLTDVVKQSTDSMLQGIRRCRVVPCMRSASPGGAAEHAAARKTPKYSSLPASHMFQPLALETLGLINSSGISFLVELGRRLTDVLGDARETMYLFQRVSLAVQRYNSVAFKGTFTVPTELD